MFEISAYEIRNTLIFKCIKFIRESNNLCLPH